MNMQQLRCLIIEDEPLAAEIVSDYVAQIDHFELIGVCHKATDALDLIGRNKVDLLFLDLHLPGIKGFDFLQTLPNPPKVIVTTAYHQYALEGYELNVVDYLVKPIEFPRFLKAVNKITSTSDSQQDATEQPITVTSNREKIRILPSEIYYVESQKDYVTIHLKEKKIRSKMTLQSVEDLLSDQEFVRIHRSFVTSISRMSSYTHQAVHILGMTLPIGRKYLAFFQLRVGAPR